jgi:LacI family transcriptional regulator
MNQKKEITIYDIANKLNLSPSTVSRGLRDNPLISERTKQRIIETAKQMGYQQNTFASNLRKNKSNTIGVVVPRLDSYFMSKVISGIEKIANQNGYNLIINQSEESGKKEGRCVETMYNSRVDGLLMSISSGTRDLTHLDIINKKGIPIVFFDRTEEFADSIAVLIDNFQAGYEATMHLLQEGCRRIMHLGGRLDRNAYSERHRGYETALKEYNISIDKELIISSDLTEESGREAVDNLLSLNPRPDAVFAANDTSAVSVICELKRKGIKVPEDIAVVGFNNDPISRVIDPNLTTVNYPGDKMGELAATTLLNQIMSKENNVDLKTIILNHHLIIRESSKRNEDL